MLTLDKKTMRGIMKSLAVKRFEFCSEADFQTALVEKVREKFPDAEIRVDCPAQLSNTSNARIDIIVNLGGKLFPIELKYKLESQKRDTQSHLDMLNDIDRLENLQIANLDLNTLNFTVTPKTIQNRFAIWLSDNHRFWSEGGTNRIHEHEKYEISWEPYVGEFKFALICF